jgi:palmitoyl-protein thioesterase
MNSIEFAGESCCGDEIRTYHSFLKQQLDDDDVYIKSVSVESDFSSDKLKSLTSHPFDQINFVCQVLQNEPKFALGYNGVGFSQGALLMRGLAQTCPNPPMHNLISLGGPQNGVNRYPRSYNWPPPFNSLTQFIISNFVFFSLIQKCAAPATYWHDTNEQRYRDKSTFLAVINNEKQFNPDFVSNLQKLNRLVLVKYEDDGAIVPNESTWFGFYDRLGLQFPMEDTEMYKNNKLGLREMKESGKLVLLLSPRDHLEIDEAWFAQNVVPYLKEL